VKQSKGKSGGGPPSPRKKKSLEENLTSRQECRKKYRARGSAGKRKSVQGRETKKHDESHLKEATWENDSRKVSSDKKTSVEEKNKNKCRRSARKNLPRKKLPRKKLGEGCKKTTGPGGGSGQRLT